MLLKLWSALFSLILFLLMSIFSDSNIVNSGLTVILGMGYIWHPVETVYIAFLII